MLEFLVAYKLLGFAQDLFGAVIDYRPTSRNTRRKNIKYLKNL
jgi:hypothetical protein